MTADLPYRIDGPAAWIGADMAASPSQWQHHLTRDQIAELERAALHFIASGKDLAQMTAADFPLPSLGPWLKGLRHRLLVGPGFQVTRGLPVSRYSKETFTTIYCGIGSHLGVARSQNAKGHLLGHVTDLGADPANPATRIYQTNARQTFHTDSADVVGLLCLREAEAGGDSLLVSAETIFNEMVRKRPDLVGLLFDPLATDRRGEVPEGAAPFLTIPPLSWHEGRLCVFYQRQYIDSAQRFPQAMRLTPTHVEALDLFDALANDRRLHLRMRLRSGDMQFVYNHSLLHDRTGFRDHADPERRRHLLRLWLSIPGDRALPSVFAERYGDLTPGQRGGIVTAGTVPHVPFDPV